MRLILEPDATFHELADPDFPLARVWRGHTAEGRPVQAWLIRVASDDEPEVVSTAAGTTLEQEAA